MSPAAARARAGGKLILLGEHAVVYGRPALAAGLAIGTTAEARFGDGPRCEGIPPSVGDDARPHALVEAVARRVGLDPGRLVVRVASELPPGRGFGSSAALCVAVLRAAAELAQFPLTPADTLAAGRELEGLFHGRSSGIDPAAAALGGVFRFERGEPPAITPVVFPGALSLVVAFGDRPRSTGAAVGGLRDRWEADRAKYDAAFDAIGAVVARGTDALRSGDLPALGAAFDDNQRLLEAIGVSSVEVERLATAARAAGALGAKLTGGGAGGAVIAIARDADAVTLRLVAEGWETRVVRVYGS